MADVQKSMASLMTETRKFPPPKSVQSGAYIKSIQQYQQMWEQSINDPETFWLKQAESLSWFTKPTKALQYTWSTEKRN